jgi:cyclophilin family peptidyl-prolyl cis-trans isomerase
VSGGARTWGRFDLELMTSSWGHLIAGGQSIYGAPFADEFHSRLRFNHRGLVACANAGTPHSNGSQFFITLDRCDWLDKKNTIFGKVLCLFHCSSLRIPLYSVVPLESSWLDTVQVTGDSIFNLLSLADVETDKDDRPVYPQKILSVEVAFSCHILLLSLFWYLPVFGLGFYLFFCYYW